MHTLVIETATAACSVALVEGRALIAERHSVVGRGHAEHLLPMIAELPRGGRAEFILVDCGPGSFTGIRVGIAAARALAFGWNAELAGFSSLPLIAAAALADHPDWRDVAVVLDGGHGEVFVQCFANPLAAIGPAASLLPAAALAVIGDSPVVGTGRRALSIFSADLAGHGRLPRAADARFLGDDWHALAATPLYGRAPDAKPRAAA
ncbi:MAG: tRNA (adenosine(37)-N6)-threonylcarbamoyltransferase complex dimerization subunit type 1 TsaB [Sphingomonas sp.]|nr:tRNA (adenosine(37)-N6)-threonylcarbamoyltransferase complex dimerization subunit type 1 TsaB [Sphingomonas sp.]